MGKDGMLAMWVGSSSGGDLQQGGDRTIYAQIKTTGHSAMWCFHWVVLPLQQGPQGNRAQRGVVLPLQQGPKGSSLV
ncbi:hypothetical protein PR002_g18020 [Phytophthora rubi]|uniref:Uncharacterized protein n=1 Tax=Phytophthora rubi TaxID=129364 RepID=A0A6A3K1R3_9STRA|nr:hypothetical protein PR002_g18020 [Phytophthora rubi]